MLRRHSQGFSQTLAPWLVLCALGTAGCEGPREPAHSQAEAPVADREDVDSDHPALTLSALQD